MTSESCMLKKNVLKGKSRAKGQKGNAMTYSSQNMLSMCQVCVASEPLSSSLCL